MKAKSVFDHAFDLYSEVRTLNEATKSNNLTLERKDALIKSLLDENEKLKNS